MRDKKCEMREKKCEKSPPLVPVPSPLSKWQTEKRLLIILAYKLCDCLLSSVLCFRRRGYGKWSCLYLFVFLLHVFLT